MLSDLEEQNSINLSFVSIQRRVLKRMESEYGLTYFVLLYMAVFTTLFVVSYLNPPKFYKDFVSKIFNMGIRWRGFKWKVYHLFLAFDFVLGILLIFLQLLSFQFSPNLNVVETYENKMYRLKYKWMLETQIWLLSLIIIEISSLYRLASIYDDMVIIKEKINERNKLEKIEDGEKIDNLPTRESMRYDTNENIIH
jgi:hypothetical protein